MSGGYYTTTVVLLILVGFFIGSRLCQAVITICIYGLVTSFALCNGHVMTVGPKTIIY